MTVYRFRDPDTCGGRGALKIGYTEKHSIDRLRSLQTSCASQLELVAEVRDASKELEQELHLLFAKYRLRDGGEWFEDCDEIRDQFEYWVERVEVLAEPLRALRRWISAELEAQRRRRLMAECAARGIVIACDPAGA